MTKTTHENLALHSDDGHLHLPRRQRVWRNARRAGVVVLALLALGAVRVLMGRATSRAELETQSLESQRIFVRTATPVPSKSGGMLSLPATLRGDNETAIYARVSGYVQSFAVEIGARVTTGQLLAELDTPELDQQVRQAAAQLEQAKANVVLGKVALDRWQKLFKEDSVARQALDEKQNAYDTAVAAQNAAAANLRQLQATTAFKRVLAPFDGVITARNVNVGNLVNAGSGGVSLFSMATTDPLRVFVDVPQAYVNLVPLGAKVAVTQPELPGQNFTATVTHIAGAIDVATRSLRVELILPNAEGRLKPGAYVQVALPLTPKGALSIPANTLLFRAEGPNVAVVDASDTIRLRPVTIARDLGATLEISAGVEADDRIVINPPDSLINGEGVSIVPAPTPGAAK
ncbi:efflux RND transporter periplasmic adaptor subunit [Rhodoblastus sp.]|uniref:efflux RND transporter periplasmic adaptor subunit n=1 Tax=Rhodoblastus sp. TaxID=1962975 RepID=UPI0025FB6039|nr:efflux RND transporter periplasmic adaptor subunit [Rhodoblastus sp.]